MTKETPKTTVKNGARGRIRTGTAIRPRDFKSLASTSFATRAALILKGFLPFTVGYNLWGTARALQLSNSSL